MSEITNEVKFHTKRKSARLEIIFGCMYSGKTSKLIREWEKRTSIGIKVLVINYIKDTRYGNDDYLYSHSNNKIPCVRIEKLCDVEIDRLENVDTILINEGQFFDDLESSVRLWLEKYNKEIIVSGLDGDFKRKKFGQLLDIVPLADDVHKVKALCSICKDGTPALFTKRLSIEEEQLVIGGDDKYIPVCRFHYSN